MSKNNWNNDKTKQAEEKDVYWEDLMQLKDETVESLISQQTLVTTFIEQAMPSLKDKQNVLTQLKGLLETFKDVTDVIYKNMCLHITFGENNTIIDYKKGKINIDDEEYLDFIKITSNYIMAQEQIAGLTCNGYTELLTTLSQQDSSLVDKKDIDSLNKVYKDGVANNQKLVKEMFSGKQRKSKSRKK